MRSQRVLWRSVADGVIVLPVDAAEPFLLMGSGAVLWDILVAPVTTEEAAAALAQQFGIPPELAEEDMRPCLRDLVERGAVTGAA